MTTEAENEEFPIFWGFVMRGDTSNGRSVKLRRRM